MPEEREASKHGSHFDAEKDQKHLHPDRKAGRKTLAKDYPQENLGPGASRPMP